MGEVVGRDSPLDDLPADATLVIAGPPMTGKYELMLKILTHYTDKAIVISTKNSSSRVLADFDDVTDGVPYGPIGIVECSSQIGGIEEENETELIKRAESPENLTRIGVKFTELFEYFYEEESDADVGVGIHSISQLLMHSELKNVYQFLHVLISQVQKVDWRCVAVLDTTVNEEAQQTLYHHFDGIIETQENEQGQREFRVRGLAPSSSDWSPF